MKKRRTAAAAAGQSASDGLKISQVPPTIANKASPVQTWLPSGQVAEERHPGRVSDRHTTVHTGSVCPQHVSIGGLTAVVVRPNPFRWPVSKLAGCLRWLNPLHNPPAGSIWSHVPGETARAQSTQPVLTLRLCSVCTEEARHERDSPPGRARADPHT